MTNFYHRSYFILFYFYLFDYYFFPPSSHPLLPVMKCTKLKEEWTFRFQKVKINTMWKHLLVFIQFLQLVLAFIQQEKRFVYQKKKICFILVNNPNTLLIFKKRVQDSLLISFLLFLPPFPFPSSPAQARIPRNPWKRARKTSKTRGRNRFDEEKQSFCLFG